MTQIAKMFTHRVVYLTTDAMPSTRGGSGAIANIEVIRTVLSALAPFCLVGLICAAVSGRVWQGAG